MKFALKSKFSLILLIFVLLSTLAIPAKAMGLDETPVDIVYSYVDVSDEKLNRNNRTEKDFDNEELKYSMRSVFKNIPWINKIFIITPNDKIKFLDDSDKISEKIVYVKDKDFLGFDTTSSITLEFNLWKLKEFGCSENFIYLNDDYFIGKPLEKSDFFYEENGKVTPYIFYNGVLSDNKNEEIDKRYKSLEPEILNTLKQTSSFYRFQTLQSHKLLYKIFNKKAKVPSNLFCTLHNAKGYNLNELKEAYDVIENNYECAHDCLNSTYRKYNQITHQHFYDYYHLNKNGKKIREMDYVFADLNKVPDKNFNCSLFCINTGDDNYTLEKKNVKDIMEKLFPDKTIYEK